MPSGKQETVTNTTAKPYPGSVKLIDKGLKDAFDLYKNGIGGDVDTSSHVVPMSQYETKAYDNLTGIANRNSGSRGLQGNLQGIINNGGFNDFQNRSLNNMTSQLKQLGGNGLSNAQDQALQNYRQTANANYSLNANPGAKGVLNAAIRDTTDAVNLNAAASGRYGSGTHEGVLAKQVGDLSNNFRYNDFNTFLQRQDAANAGMASLGQQGVQNRQGLSSSIFNAGQAGLGNMTQAYQGLQAPEQTRLGIGQAYDQQYADLINDRSRIFQAQQNSGWDQIGRLLNVANLNGQYKDTSGTTVAPGPNPFLQALGMGATGANLLFGNQALSGGLLGLL